MKVTQKIRDELASLYKRHGKLSTEIVVTASKHVGSSFHTHMLWDDDAAAANLGRLELARQLIMSVHITASEQEQLNVSVKLRKYPGCVGGDYLDVFDVVRRPDAMESLLEAALREMRGFRQKYGALKVLSDVLQAIDDVQLEAQT